MNRVRVRVFGLALGSLALTAIACGLDITGTSEGNANPNPNGEGGAATSASSSSSGASGDGSTNPGDLDSSTSNGNDAATDSGLPNDGCISFAQGLAGFTYESESGATYELVPNIGVKLTLKSGARSAIYGTITSPIGVYTESDVQAFVTLGNVNSGWGTGSSDYTPFLKQNYGASRVAEQASSVELMFAQGKFDLNTWNPGYTGNSINFNIPSGDSTFQSTIKWDTNSGTGRVQTKVNTNTDSRTKKTLGTGPTDKLTISFGGKASGSVPESTVVVKRICITFH